MQTREVVLHTRGGASRGGRSALVTIRGQAQADGSLLGANGIRWLLPREEVKTWKPSRLRNA